MKTRYWSRTSILAAVVLTASAGFASCDNEKTGTEPEPPVELKDQIEYNGGSPLNIMSAIYEVTGDDSYTFYLSPTAGITGMDAMKEADDYLLVSVKDPKGTVDTETEDFTVSFGDIKADKSTMSTDVKELKLSADLVAETETLNLHLELTMQSGKTLLAKYNNKCTEAEPVQLANQYELDKVISSIGSALVSKNPAESTTTYIFYEEEDVTEGSAKALEIKVADDIDTKAIDLATADAAKVSVTCGAFKNEAGTTGSLSIVISTGSNTLTVSLDAENGSNTLRANYKGSYDTDYESKDYLKVTPASGEATEVTVGKVFRYKGAGLSNTFMLGTAESPATPEDLANNGGYAVKFVLSDKLLGQTVKLEDRQCRFITYDYNLYRMYDNNDATGENVTGTITTSVDGDNVYIRFSAQYPDGPAVEGEWYGTVTAATEDTDLTPVEPFRPRITITSPNGETVLDWEITAMELRHQTNATDYNTGDKITAYILHFKTENTEMSGGIDSNTGTPTFTLPDDYLGKADVDLVTEGDKAKWSFNFNNSNLSSYSGYGYSNSWMKRSPTEAKLTSKKDGSNWEFKFEMTDIVDKGWAQEGTGNKLIIEWKGPATKYSGSKTNDLTDSDY